MNVPWAMMEIRPAYLCQGRRFALGGRYHGTRVPDRTQLISPRRLSPHLAL